MNRLALALSLSSLAALGLTPRPAEACGGTFCDVGPSAAPVDQSGENILFVMGGDYTEAHIQIQYDPTIAAKFAWVVPISTLPTFSVGSDALFDNVLAATVPQYGFSYQRDNCGDGGGSGEAGADDFGGTTGGFGDSSGGPEIVLQETVGAFDITVLQGGTAAEVIAWLDANEYQQDPDAQPIFEEYLGEEYLFAAFKLTNGADVTEIHPIVLRFANNEACVPIRLTRIAAVEDMDIRSFFLADARVVPQTYKHVLVNPLRLDWPNLASNYKDVITQAVDAFEAEGRAFVTEYSGSSGVVSPLGIYSETWNASAFTDLPAVDVIDTLSSQGLVDCFGGGGGTGGGSECQYLHPLLRGLLADYLPVPDGLDEITFYGCLSCYEDQIDLAAWGNGSAFAGAMQTRMIEPGQHAIEMLNAFPVLTRMYTTISPAEMTVDPFFWANPDLPGVDLTNQIATRRVLCNGDAVWTLPDGREVYVPGDGAWPDFSSEMPYEEEVAQIGEAGAPVALLQNTEAINVELRTHNCQYNWPSAEDCGGGGSDTSAGEGSTSFGSGPGGGSSGDASSGGSPGLDDDGGCGCRGTDPGAGALLVLGTIALGRRRRRSA